MNENLFSHSECSSAKLIFQVLMPVGSSVVEFLSVKHFIIMFVAHVC